MDRGVHRVKRVRHDWSDLAHSRASLYLLPHVTSHPSETNEELQAALTGVPPDQLLLPPFPLPDLQQFPIQKEEQMTISVLSGSVLSYDSQHCSGLISKMFPPQSLSQLSSSWDFRSKFPKRQISTCCLTFSSLSFISMHWTLLRAVKGLRFYAPCKLIT